MINNQRYINPIWVKTITDDPSLIPEYQTNGSAGCDLKAANSVIILPMRRSIIETGVKLEIQNGYGAYVCSRSGLAANNGIIVLNAPGIIDCDFRGMIKVILCNLGNEEFVINKGDRIAQLLFFPIVQAIFQQSNVINETFRGEGGFGSTGV